MEAALQRFLQSFIAAASLVCLALPTSESLPSTMVCCLSNRSRYEEQSRELEREREIPHMCLLQQAVDDCMAWYEQLLKDGVAPASIFVAGDSAGGYLGTLAIALSLRA